MNVVTEAQFSDAVLLPSFQKSIVVLFGASWCGPCKVMKPLIERLSAPLDFPLVGVDVGVEKGLAKFYNVRAVPTLAVFRNGKLIAWTAGGKTEAQVRSFLYSAGVTQGELEA